MLGVQGGATQCFSGVGKGGGTGGPEFVGGERVGEGEDACDLRLGTGAGAGAVMGRCRGRGRGRSLRNRRRGGRNKTEEMSDSRFREVERRHNWVAPAAAVDQDEPVALP